VAKPLRGDEILACVHRVALSRGAPFAYSAPVTSAEIERRRRDAESHRRGTIAHIHEHHPGAEMATGVEHTTALLDAGAALILTPHLPVDVEGGRRASVQALTRVGRFHDRFAYAPVVIKNNEIVESAPTRRTLTGTLDSLTPAEAVYADGIGIRSTPTVTRNGILLAHATRVLQAMGRADPGARAAMIDRHRQVWWLDLTGQNYPRFSLSTYDELYAQRRSVIAAHERWQAGESDFPTSPYWHRECLDCPFAEHCHEELEASDDVSLTRFTNFDQQLLLREHGITTRYALASLDPQRARLARRRVLAPHEDFKREDVLGRAIDKLDDLIYRARVHVRGSSLRIVDFEKMGCPSADVEVDIDMESYGEATYLWGAYVTVNTATANVRTGYHPFVEWGYLDATSEAELFARFWTWFQELRTTCHEQERSIIGYCFWAQAEDGAMNRAVAVPVPGGPTMKDLEEFRTHVPAEWVDLHEQAKRQVQTDGPLGLKLLASAAGFGWRDPNPSGEASMLWYEVATGAEPDAMASRQRILDYNEDDCRATKALRDWLNGPARSLAHRDEFEAPDHR